MKRAMILSVVLLLAVVPFGCKNEKDAVLAPSSIVARRVPVVTILAEAGEEFELSLYNPHYDAGYMWLYAQEFSTLFVELLDYRMEPENPGLLGSPVYEIWTFRAKKRGRAHAMLECVRPWLEEDTPRDEIRVVVSIQ